MLFFVGFSFFLWSNVVFFLLSKFFTFTFGATFLLFSLHITALHTIHSLDCLFALSRHHSLFAPLFSIRNFIVTKYTSHLFISSSLLSKFLSAHTYIIISFGFFVSFWIISRPLNLLSSLRLQTKFNVIFYFSFHYSFRPADFSTRPLYKPNPIFRGITHSLFGYIVCFECRSCGCLLNWTWWITGDFDWMCEPPVRKRCGQWGPLIVLKYLLMWMRSIIQTPWKVNDSSARDINNKKDVQVVDQLLYLTSLRGTRRPEVFRTSDICYWKISKVSTSASGPVVQCTASFRLRGRSTRDVGVYPGGRQVQVRVMMNVVLGPPPMINNAYKCFHKSVNRIRPEYCYCIALKSFWGNAMPVLPISYQE